MTLNDPLANALNVITNAEKRGKESCMIMPSSKVIRAVLELMKDNLYVGDIEDASDIRIGTIKVNLLGNVNKCGAVKPRFSITKTNYEKFEKRYLPAKGFGVLIVTTSKGIMLHAEALKKGIGGKLLAYCY